jgi:hypothetical protein
LNKFFFAGIEVYSGSFYVIIGLIWLAEKDATGVIQGRIDSIAYDRRGLPGSTAGVRRNV